MDILSIVQNHLYKCIIDQESVSHIVSHNIGNTTEVTESEYLLGLTLRVHTGINEYFEYHCNNIHVWVSMCQYIRDVLKEFSADTCTDVLVVDIHMDVTEDALDTLEQYLSCIHDLSQSYPPVSLYQIKIAKYIHPDAYRWFSSMIHTDDATLPGIRIGSINWEHVHKLLDAVELSNYLGCESFSVYTFMFMHPISVSLSMKERESLLGHRYFMLPIEGWDHPLQQIYQIPLIKESELLHCIDTKYKELSSMLLN